MPDWQVRKRVEVLAAVPTWAGNQFSGMAQAGTLGGGQGRVPTLPRPHLTQNDNGSNAPTLEGGTLEPLSFVDQLVW